MSEQQPPLQFATNKLKKKATLPATKFIKVSSQSNRMPHHLKINSLAATARLSGDLQSSGNMTAIPGYYVDSSREYLMVQRESKNPQQNTILSKISQNIAGQQHHTKSASDTTWISANGYFQRQATETDNKERISQETFNKQLKSVNSGGYQQNNKFKDSNELINEIFVNQNRFIQRVPTPELTNKVHEFSRKRKQILLQISSNYSGGGDLATSATTNTLKTETSETSKQKLQSSLLFEDRKFNARLTSEHLQKARMLSPRQREKNSSLEHLTSRSDIFKNPETPPLRAIKGKAEVGLKTLNSQQPSKTSYLHDALTDQTTEKQFEKYANSSSKYQQQSLLFSASSKLLSPKLLAQISPGTPIPHMPAISNVRKQATFEAFKQQKEIIQKIPLEETERRNSVGCETNFNLNKNNFDAGTNKNNSVTPSNQMSSNINKNIQSSTQLSQQQTKWKFNNPLIGQHHHLNVDNIYGSCENIPILEEQSQPKTAQSSSQTQLKTITTTASGIQRQSTMKITGRTTHRRQESLNSKIAVGEQTPQQGMLTKREKTPRFNTASQLMYFGGNLSQRYEDSVNDFSQLKLLTTTGTLAQIDQSCPSIVALETKQPQQQQQQQSQTRFQKNNQFDKKATPKNNETTERHKNIKSSSQQQQYQQQSQQSNSIATNKLFKNRQSMMALNGQTWVQQSPIRIETQGLRRQSMQSHSPDNSPIKRRFLLQQMQDDNYSMMYKTLVDSLTENEVIGQYIEQSGYSVDMFAFYMMKLYVYCSENLVFPKNPKSQSYHSRSGSSSPIQSNDRQKQKSKHLIINLTGVNQQKQPFYSETQENQQLQMKQSTTKSKISVEFPTLKVNETTLLFVRDVFAEKMKDLQMQNSLVTNFSQKFTSSIKQFMPQTFLDDLGGNEKIRLVVSNLLEHLCYESGVVSTFDEELINEITEGAMCMLRSEQELLGNFLEKIKNNSNHKQISDAEFYLVKISLWRIMASMGFESQQILQVESRIQRQREYFFQMNNFSKDNSFKQNFIQTITKCKKIIGYFLDPSQSTIATFYEHLFGCLLGVSRYIDLVDFLEHKLKTRGEVPEVMLDELSRIILELTKQYFNPNNSQDQYHLFLVQKDILIKIERIKQKANILNLSFLNLPMSANALSQRINDWCVTALISANLPKEIQETQLINTKFLEEYFFLVLSQEEQVFSIFDLDFAVSYHNMPDYEFCFSFWFAGLEEILSKSNEISSEDLEQLMVFLRLNSLLPL